LTVLPTALFPRLPRNFLEVSEFQELRSRVSTIVFFLKGVLIMTTFPVADGARMLGIHPKTLHHWLTQANVPFAAHPTDARIKCLTEEHLQEVARLHGRPLQSLASAALLDAPSSPSLPQRQPKPSPADEREPPQTASFLPALCVSEADLIQKLSCLETKVVTLQEQLTQLALVLLQERERSVEHRLTALESLLQPLVGRQLSAPPTPEAEQEPPWTLPGPRPLHPVEQLARSRRPPLIEYSAPGIYVIISSHEGEVHLQPNSRAWFDWLATLSSFRFIGPVGRFTAHRGYKQGQQTLYWSASRCVRRHTYKHYLGMTESLTLASLEHTAARLQSDVDAR
jgi:DNA-binding transcriptional MerR regulator